MKIKYVHTNIISKDWRRLSNFYQEVFGCEPVLPERNLKGKWLDEGTGVKNAHLEGIHLRLPGYNENEPTLEIFSYSETLEAEKPLPNRKGFAHIAFRVDDVHSITELAIQHGASKIGEISSGQINDVGLLTFVYIADPDGNIIEIQKII
jgi:catechol 2,3-dioxygenase-like lactoylglutathione lyase family enzyme